MHYLEHGPRLLSVPGIVHVLVFDSFPLFELPIELEPVSNELASELGLELGLGLAHVLEPGLGLVEPELELEPTLSVVAGISAIADVATPVAVIGVVSFAIQRGVEAQQNMMRMG